MTTTTTHRPAAHRGIRIIVGLAAATRRWRARGALVPAGGAGPWGDYADPDRDHTRVLADLCALRVTR